MPTSGGTPHTAAGRRRRGTGGASARAFACISSLRNAGEDSELVKVAVLIDELKHEDVQLRLNSMRQLAVIGERARESTRAGVTR